ncbi:MAG TPA: TlpA disulfide reductase family protein [Terriglobia bacterium]|nr:TlpA disulfide reductase family protein [Terriglobia bacterium]
MGTKTTIRTGEQAPSVSLADTTGHTHSLAEALTQGPVLLAFFKVGCPTCQYAFPFIERLHRQFAADGAAVWGISQDDEAASRRFASDYGVSFPILIDAKPYSVSNDYGIGYTPTLFLVARDGTVKLAGDGFSKQDLIETQKWLAESLSLNPGDLFLPGERVPEFKPG